MHFPPPAKPRRGAVRRQSDNVHRLGRIEQSERPRRRLAFRRFGPCFDSRRGDRSGAAFALGLMSVALHETQHARAAETRRQTIKQFAELPLGLPRFEGDKVALRRAEIFRARHGQAQRVETETGIERIGQRIELFMKQPGKDFRIARRPQGLDRQPAHGAVGAKKTRLERTPALAAPLQNGFGLMDQIAQNGLDGLALRQRLGEMAFDHAIGRRTQGGDAQILPSKQTFDFAWEIGAETRGESARRTRGEIADGFQAGATQGEQAVLLALQCGERQARDRRRRLSARENAALRKTRQSARAIGRRRQRRAGGKSERRHALSAPDKRPSSPPNRCAQPVTSRTRPCGSSKAVRGV